MIHRYTIIRNKKKQLLLLYNMQSSLLRNRKFLILKPIEHRSVKHQLQYKQNPTILKTTKRFGLSVCQSLTLVSGFCSESALVQGRCNGRPHNNDNFVSFSAFLGQYSSRLGCIHCKLSCSSSYILFHFLNRIYPTRSIFDFPTVHYHK